MRLRPLVSALAMALVAGLFLAACDEAEQDRVLRYDKGTYIGQKDRPLTDQEREELRRRTRLQHVI